MVKKIIVLHIGKYFPPFHGGIENVTADLMEVQNASDIHSIAIVHQHEKGVPFQEERLRQGLVKRVPIIGKAIFVPLAPQFPKYLSETLRRIETPAVLHMHLPNVSCFWALFSSKARNIPWVIHWHSDVLGAAPDWRVKLLYPLYRIFEKALLRKAKAVIVTSPGYLESSNALKAFRAKCRVIPLGIADRVCSSPEDSKSKTDQLLKLLCVGRMTYYKGHKYLIEALSTLRDRGENVSLSIVGRGELEDTLRDDTSRRELNDFVSFAGSVSDSELKMLMQECDMLCLPSIERTEAFGVVLLEAMRAGKPCLVTDVPGSGMNWVVQDGKTGFVVKASDANVIADSLVYASQNKEKLREMGQAGRKRFEEHFTITKVAEKIEALYEEVLANHSSLPSRR